MTVDERIEEIRKNTETYLDSMPITKSDIELLLTLVKVQREALVQINSNRYDPIVILDLVHRALNWKQGGIEE